MDRILLWTIQQWEFGDSAVMDSSKAPKKILTNSCITEKRKSAGIDNTPAFVQNIQVGRNTTTDVLTEIFPQQGNLTALRSGRA